MIIGQDVIEFYEYFYIQKYGNKEYRFKPSEKAKKQIDSFLTFLDQRYSIYCLGKIFLTRYFSFQFNRLEGQVFKRFSSKDKSGRIQIYDIIGKKAQSYYINRNTDFDYKIIMPIQPTFSDDVCNSSKHEEIEKARFYNSDRGFLNCVEKTTLFNHKSQLCVMCMFKSDCKKILQRNYNKIYTERGYDAAAR